MTAKRLFWLLAAVMALLLVGLAGSVYAMDKLVQSKSDELATSRGTIEQLTAQQTGLVKSKQDVQNYSDLEKITKAVVPQDKDQAQSVRELTNIAAANDITLNTITFPSSTLGSTTTTSNNLSQLTPVKGIPGVYDLQITLANSDSSTVTFNQLSAFLEDLENNRRTAAVDSLSITPLKDNAKRLTFSLVINTYIKP